MREGAYRNAHEWPKAVIFDLDGTLVDSVADIAFALNRTLEECSLAPYPLETVRTMIGGGLKQLLDRALGARDLPRDARDRAAARLVEFYAAEPAVLSRLYPGVAETLDALRESGIAVGLCTNKPGHISREVLRKLAVIDRFNCLNCGDGDLPNKPHPAGLLKTMETLGAEPASTVMVGDSIVDVEAARAADLGGVILVSYGYSAAPVSELGADAVINRLHELVPALALLAARQ
jgi:phosphoglycolate phosphatase